MSTTISCVIYYIAIILKISCKEKSVYFYIQQTYAECLPGNQVYFREQKGTEELLRTKCERGDM